MINSYKSIKMAQFHLFKHSNGKFDVAFVSNGKMVFDTQPQGYERKAGCYKAIRSLMKKFDDSMTTFQDDTFDTPRVYSVKIKGVVRFWPACKPVAKYKPKTKKR